MTATRPSLHQIEQFLERKRFAAIGVSHNPKDFSRALYAEFLRRGYDVIPVNPAIPEIGERPCFARLRDISPPVEAVLLLTSPAVSEELATQCVEAGVQQVWMFRAAGSGAVSERAVTLCQLNGIDVIAGECPFMFFPKPGFIHAAHGVCRKWMRRFPC